MDERRPGRVRRSRGRSLPKAPADRCQQTPPGQKFVREIGWCLYPGLVVVHIWLPADVHRRLLEGLPSWSPAHEPLNDATEMECAVGVRRVSCRLSDAMALLQFAERLYPESAPLIRNAIRRTGTTHSTRSHSVPPLPGNPRRSVRDGRPQRPALRRLATLYLVVFSFQFLHWADRSREALRRLL